MKTKQNKNKKNLNEMPVNTRMIFLKQSNTFCWRCRQIRNLIPCQGACKTPNHSEKQFSSSTLSRISCYHMTHQFHSKAYNQKDWKHMPRQKCVHQVQNSISHNNQKMELSQVFITDKWIKIWYIHG